MKVLGTTLEEIPWAISIILYKVRKVMVLEDSDPTHKVTVSVANFADLPKILLRKFFLPVGGGNTVSFTSTWKREAFGMCSALFLGGYLGASSCEYQSFRETPGTIGNCV